MIDELNFLLSVGWLAVEAVTGSWYCLWYELSPFALSTSYTQWPEDWKHPC